MEAQPTIETVPEVVQKDKTEVSEEPCIKTEETTRPPVDIGMLMNDVFKNLNIPPVRKADENKTETVKPSSPNMSEFLNIVKLAMPILMTILQSRPTEIPERGTAVKAPKFRKTKATTSKENALVVQIIIGKFSFLVTRSNSKQYLVVFRRDTAFQRKLLTKKGLYNLLKNLTDNCDNSIHFGLICNDEALDTRIIDALEINKKTLKKTIRYFLSLL